MKNLKRKLGLAVGSVVGLALSVGAHAQEGSGFDPVDSVIAVFTGMEARFETLYEAALPVMVVIIGAFVVLKLGKRLASRI